MQLEIVKANDGATVAVYLNEYRIAGGKPWGGGTIWRKWDVNIDELQQLINEERAKSVLTAINDAREEAGEDDRE